jgi:hypothetical protein
MIGKVVISGIYHIIYNQLQIKTDEELRMVGDIIQAELNIDIKKLRYVTMDIRMEEELTIVISVRHASELSGSTSIVTSNNS